MNGTCAGGTGAFIDQMATLLDVKSEDMNSLAEKAEKVYTIASRCGVFAKSDIQPLLNQGAKKSVIALSIFYAVVNQTIPLILCEEEDVEGNHGATIGKLDEELLFYLESRGMSEEAVYEMVEDDSELMAVSKVFQEMLDNVDITM